MVGASAHWCEHRDCRHGWRTPPHPEADCDLAGRALGGGRDWQEPPVGWHPSVDQYVWYHPVLGGPGYAGTVADVSRKVGDTVCYPLKDLEPAYGRDTGRTGRTRVAAASIHALRPRVAPATPPADPGGDLRAEVQRRLDRRVAEQRARKPADPPPRYDEVFATGTAALSEPPAERRGVDEGKCSWCGGSGKQLCPIGVSEYADPDPCSGCGGTGRQPKREPAQPSVPLSQLTAALGLAEGAPAGECLEQARHLADYAQHTRACKHRWSLVLSALAALPEWPAATGEEGSLAAQAPAPSPLPPHDPIELRLLVDLLTQEETRLKGQRHHDDTWAAWRDHRVQLLQRARARLVGLLEAPAQVTP